MPSSVSQFIRRLSQVSAPPNAFNPYAAGDQSNVQRRTNLQLYLEEILHIGPRVMMLGEAPGYQGCRLTGVPFMSEDILLKGVPELGMFGVERGYGKTQEFERPRREPSATIVWSTFARLGFVPLLWSAYPFHPHQPGNSWSNRAPTRDEVRLGQSFVRELLSAFQIKTIVAIGNVAHASLQSMGIDATKVRHPAHGGKHEFVAGVKKLVLKNRK